MGEIFSERTFVGCLLFWIVIVVVSRAFPRIGAASNNKYFVGALAACLVATLLLAFLIGIGWAVGWVTYWEGSDQEWRDKHHICGPDEYLNTASRWTGTEWESEQECRKKSPRPAPLW